MHDILSYIRCDHELKKGDLNQTSKIISNYNTKPFKKKCELK